TPTPGTRTTWPPTPDGDGRGRPGPGLPHPEYCHSVCCAVGAQTDCTTTSEAVHNPRTLSDMPRFSGLIRPPEGCRADPGCTSAQHPTPSRPVTELSRVEKARDPTVAGPLCPARAPEKEDQWPKPPPRKKPRRPRRPSTPRRCAPTSNAPWPRPWKRPSPNAPRKTGTGLRHGCARWRTTRYACGYGCSTNPDWWPRPWWPPP